MKSLTENQINMNGKSRKLREREGEIASAMAILNNVKGMTTLHFKIN